MTLPHSLHVSSHTSCGFLFVMLMRGYMSLSKPQPNGQTLWVYLLTGAHPTAVPGLSTVGAAALAEAPVPYRFSRLCAISRENDTRRALSSLLKKYSTSSAINVVAQRKSRSYDSGFCCVYAAHRFWGKLGRKQFKPSLSG